MHQQSLLNIIKESSLPQEAKDALTQFVLDQNQVAVSDGTREFVADVMESYASLYEDQANALEEYADTITDTFESLEEKAQEWLLADMDIDIEQNRALAHNLLTQLKARLQANES